MTDKGSQASRDGMEQLTVVTLSDFEAVDFEAPIRDTDEMDCLELSSMFCSAAAKQMDAGDDCAIRVFELLAGVASINLKPWDRAEPYGPDRVYGDRRSIIPSDLKGEQSRVFSAVAPNIRNAALRGRLADIVWQNDRSQAEMARLAISSFCEVVQLVLEGKAAFSPVKLKASSSPACDLLSRACDISKAIGNKDPEVSELKALIQNVFQDALDNRHEKGIFNIGKLCLDRNILAPDLIVVKAEEFASAEDTRPQIERNLWELAAQGYHLSRKELDEHRCHKNAAECFVKMALEAGGEGLVDASFISDAIEAYRNIPGTKERREELQKLLRNAQTSIGDEMHISSIESDLSAFIKKAQDLIANKRLSKALENFASLTNSPDRSSLQNEVARQVEEHPSLGITPFKRIDSAGRVVAKSPGLLGAGENQDESMRYLIADYEALRRGRAVHGLIEPARCVIHSEHSLDQSYFLRIAEMSPFVPIDRVDVFALGFIRFFQGDFISAAHILVPQLESSVRHILSLIGQDTWTIRSDMTEESRSLSSMLNNCQDELERILGPAIVFDMDNVFVFEGGPKIRHRIAHGLISGAECFSADAIYACWLIYRLCCLPSLRNWAKVAESLDEIAN